MTTNRVRDTDPTRVPAERTDREPLAALVGQPLDPRWASSTEVPVASFNSSI